MEIDLLWKATEGEMFETFLQMTDEEAKLFFDGYLEFGKERLVLLRRRFCENGDKEDDLDFSPASLVPLWRWAKRRLQTRELTHEEMRHIRSVPESFQRDLLRSKPLSEGSLILVNDIAYYFAEVFIRNHVGVRWKICKTKIKRHVDANQPILSGFRVSMNPRDLVRVVASEAMDAKGGDESLRELYDIWRKNLQKA